jgi:hypothetical protein
VSETQGRTQYSQRGSALLLSVLLTIVGAAILGLSVDVMSLIWVRSNAQITANLAVAAVALELEHNPSAPGPYLLEVARATAARNGYHHGADSDTIHLNQQHGEVAVLVERYTGIYFLRMIRPQPVPVRARAAMGVPPVKAAL